MLLEDVQARLRMALTMTIVEEYSLFAAGSEVMPPSERAVIAQLAFRLRHVFEDQWDVDIEYRSRTTFGERRAGSRSLKLPISTNLAIHRRGRSGRDDNLFLLDLMTHEAPHFEG
jgi:hypothetical protein